MQNFLSLLLLASVCTAYDYGGYDITPSDLDNLESEYPELAQSLSSEFGSNWKTTVLNLLSEYSDADFSTIPVASDDDSYSDFYAEVPDVYETYPDVFHLSDINSQSGFGVAFGSDFASATHAAKTTQDAKPSPTEAKTSPTTVGGNTGNSGNSGNNGNSGSNGNSGNNGNSGSSSSPSKGPAPKTKNSKNGGPVGVSPVPLAGVFALLAAVLI